MNESDKQNGDLAAINGNAPADAGALAKAMVSDEPLLNKQEVVELRKEVRGLEKLIKEMTGKIGAPQSTPNGEQAKPQAQAQNPDGWSAEIATLRQEIAMKDLYAELGVKPGPVRDLIDKAITVDKPGDLREYVQRYKSLYGAQDQPAGASGPPAAPGRSNTGAPATNGMGQLPTSPLQMPAGVMQSLSRDERKKVMDRYFQSAGRNYNPFRK